MKTIYRYTILLIFLPLIIFLASCAETAENEHLPEYCQTYSGFMATASKDLYDLIGGITRDEYLTAISVIELEFDVDDPEREVNLDGIQCFQNLTSLTLVGQSFKDISPISALKNIQKISLIDTSIVSIDSFKNLSKIKELNISGTKTLQSVNGIEEMTKLTSLELIDNGIVNIDGLNNLVNLTRLDISYNEISVFPNINQLNLLTELNVSFNNIYVLGDDLSGLSSLIYLNMSNNQIRDLSSLDDLTSLVTLDLSFNNLGYDPGESPDFTSLVNATNLTTILLNDNNLDSIEGLRGLNIPLETLHLENNNLEDITPISSYTGITELVLFNNNIININNLSGMTGLSEIDLSDNSIVDFSDLLSIPNLEFIYLGNNQIVSIPDLVTLSDTFWLHLSVLDLHSNVLTDVSGVEGHPTLQELIISDNGLTVLSGISDLPELEYLEIFWDIPELDEFGEFPEGFELETNLNSISTINNSFNNLPNLPLVRIDNEGEPDEDVTNIFDFGFELGPDVEIYGSINGLLTIGEIDFSGMDIDVIDEFSLSLPFVDEIDISNTDIEDIGFIMGNPELVSLDISFTPVNTLSVISGVGTSDLDNLDQVNAIDISGDNHLLDAFIELPELSVIILEGTNILTIENSFNSLNELTTFRMDSVELISIIDSFNNIFDFYTEENIIQLNLSKIGIISGSFNVGNYYFIEILENNSSGATEITDSFNDITTPANGYINISENEFASISNSFNSGEHFLVLFQDNASTGATFIANSFNGSISDYTSVLGVLGNDFKTVTDSFNNIKSEYLALSDNAIETLSTSLVNLDVELMLDLSENRLATIDDFDSLTNVPALNLSENLLITVSFLDAIPGLTDLSIADQTDDIGGTVTLTLIDGINNMPGLVSINMDYLVILSIDGFKDIGITEFSLSETTNNGFVIATITSDSFSNSLITDLDLTDHDFDNIDFLTNFTDLINLDISVDLADLSYFETAVFETTLETLALGNLQNTVDFSSLSEYDSLTFLSFEGASTLVINNLDGLNSLESINFVDRTDITEFNNSFNNMPGLSLSETYLSLYDSLSTINTSFDMYSSGDSVLIDGSIQVIDSFNHVEEVILASTTETVINFDALSFDDLVTLTIENSNHDSFSILNNYSNLDNLIIEVLEKNILDLDNSNIEVVQIDDMADSVDTLTMNINTSIGMIIFANRFDSTITLNTVNGYYVLDIPLGDVVLNVSNPQIYISANSVDFILNSSNTTSVELGEFETTTTTFNTDLLAQVWRSSFAETNATTMNINTLESTVSIDVRATVLNINDVNANNYILVVSNGDAYLNSNEINLNLNFTGNDVFVQYDLLETIDISGTSTEVVIDSINLDTVTLSAANITTATISSNQAILSITGDTVNNLDIINNSINNLTATIVGASTTLTTTNNEILDLSIHSSVFELTGDNIPEVILNSTSTVGLLDISSGLAINTMTFNNANINNIYLLSNEANMNITGTDLTNIELDMANLNAITANTVTANYDINSNVVAIDLDIIAQTVLVDSPNMTDLNIQVTSIIDTVEVLNSNLIDTITTNAAIIDIFNINSDAASIDLTGINIVDASITDNFLVGVTVDVGTNDLAVSSTKTGSASFSLTAGNVILNSALSTISVGNTSTISNLQFNTSNLTDILAGSADITIIDILNSSSSLDVTGTNVDFLTANADITTFNISVVPTTVVNFTHTGSTISTINTNTENITVNATSNIDLTSATLTASTLNLGANNATLNLSSPALDYTIDGTLNNVSINSTSLNNLIIGAGFTVDDLELVDSNVTSLDFTNGTVSNYIMSGSTTSLSVQGNDLEIISLDMPNLNNLTVNSTFVDAVLSVNSSDTTLDLNGAIDNVELLQSDLTSVDLTDVVVEILIIESDSITSLDTLTSVNYAIGIFTNNDNFNLTTSAPNVGFSSASNHNLNLTTSATNLELQTDIGSVTLDAATSNITIISDSINTLIGTVDVAVIATNSAIGILTANIDASVLNMANTGYSQVDTVGVGTIGTLTVGGPNLADVNTNAVTITDLNITETAANIDVDSIATNISVISIVSNSIAFNISINGQNIDSNLNFITLNSLNNSSTNLTYDGVSISQVTTSGINEVIFTAENASEIVLIGDVVDISVSGTLITDVTTTAFTASNKYTMNDTLITDLSFVSTGLAASLVELEVNTLDVANVSSIVEKLRDTGITLFSPITSGNIYDDFYDTEHAELTAQEALDSVRYNGFKDPLILDAFNEIRTNEYFDHVEEAALNTQIDTQTYGDMQSYLDGYIVTIIPETTEAQLTIDEGEAFVQAIRDSIQLTLDLPVLIIVELDLTTSVENSIIDDSNTHATTESGLVGFNIG